MLLKLIKNGEIRINTEIRDSLTQKYLFDWDEIPGSDSEILRDFLIKNIHIDWAKTAKIDKIDDYKTIILTDDNNFFSLELNNEKTRVILKIDGVRTENFIARTVNDRLNIYSNYEFRTIIRLDADTISFMPDPDLFKGDIELSNYKKKCQEHNKKVQDTLTKLDVAEKIKWVSYLISLAISIVVILKMNPNNLINWLPYQVILLFGIILIIIIKYIFEWIIRKYVRFQIHNILT